MALTPVRQKLCANVFQLLDDSLPRLSFLLDIYSARGLAGTIAADSCLMGNRSDGATLATRAPALLAASWKFTGWQT